MYHIGKSKIHGKGVIASRAIGEGQSLGEAIFFDWFSIIPIPYITQNLGVWINHSYDPNTQLEWRQGAWHLVANRKIERNQELTLNYDDTPWYIQGARSHYV